MVEGIWTCLDCYNNYQKGKKMELDFTPEFKALADKRRELRNEKAQLKQDIIDMQTRIERLTGMVMLINEQMQELVNTGKDRESE
jgi:uncharacterized protein YlxW (UPF0749 family)